MVAFKHNQAIYLIYINDPLVLTSDQMFFRAQKTYIYTRVG